jgi:hypothetical protein
LLKLIGLNKRKMLTKTQLLEEIKDLPEVFSLEELLALLILKSSPNSEGFERGNYTTQTKLSDFAGTWAKDDRTAEQIRKEA